jgi:hypothetical protein
MPTPSGIDRGSRQSRRYRMGDGFAVIDYGLPQQLRQLGDIRRNPTRLVSAKLCG